MPTETHGMKMAITNHGEINSLMVILNEISDLYRYELKYKNLEDIDLSEFEIMKNFNSSDYETFIENLFRHLEGIHHQRILWNADLMLSNCADLSLSHLDFNAKIKAGFEAIELLKEIDDQQLPFTEISHDHLLKIRSILDKVPYSIDPKIEAIYQGLKRYHARFDKGFHFLENGVLWYCLDMGIDKYMDMSIHERINFKGTYFF
jgi:hypothetical protein